MARIAGGNDITVAQIRAFLGLNENPDGDTALKDGELAKMRNFRITKDGHLQKRPGTRRIIGFYAKDQAAGADEDQATLLATPIEEGETPETPPAYEEDSGLNGPVERPAVPDLEGFPVDPVTGKLTCLFGCWCGMVGGARHLLVSFSGYVLDVDIANQTSSIVGRAAKAKASFFGFGGKAYLLDGEKYQMWDGDAALGFREVEGYAPVIQTATTPEGAGTALENVNRLNGLRRVQFSPDGTATDFFLPEMNIDEVLSVTVNGEPTDAYTATALNGKISFTTAPAEGTNTVEVKYRKGCGARAEVEKMRCAELFNGAQDTRVFLYGDGTNRAVYSGVEYTSGQPSAEYFPDLAEVAIGEGNTPVTALVRHYSRLMAYKPGSAWVITAGDITTQADRVTAAFYVSPVNRQIGNQALGQILLMENEPVTIDDGGIYHWHNAKGYISNNENNAKRISDRVGATFKGFADLTQLRVANIKRDSEFWFLYADTALIYNYAVDAWYYYTALPYRELVEVDGALYGISDTGFVYHISRAYRNDTELGGEEETAIECYAETGYFDFGRDWQLKYSPMLFVAIKPEAQSRVYVTVESDRRTGYPEKLVSANFSTFDHVDFNHFSFETNRRPRVRRLRLKVKKAAFYKIIYKSQDSNSTCTVIETDVRLRYAGLVK